MNRINPNLTHFIAQFFSAFWIHAHLPIFAMGGHGSDSQGNGLSSVLCGVANLSKDQTLVIFWTVEAMGHGA